MRLKTKAHTTNATNTNSNSVSKINPNTKVMISTCMDGRLPKFLKEIVRDFTSQGYAQEEIAIVSNGGGNIYGMRHTVNQLVQNGKLEWAQLLTHSDCGAIKRVAHDLGIEENAKFKYPDESISVTLVNPIDRFLRIHNLMATTRLGLETVNPLVQSFAFEDIVARILPAKHLETRTNTIELDPNGEHAHPVVTLSNPYFPIEAVEKELGHDAFYQLRAFNPEEVLPDLKLGVDLGIAELVAFPQDKEEKQLYEEFMIIAKGLMRTEKGVELSTSIVE